MPSRPLHCIDTYGQVARDTTYRTLCTSHDAQHRLPQLAGSASMKIRHVDPAIWNSIGPQALAGVTSEAGTDPHAGSITGSSRERAMRFYDRRTPPKRMYRTHGPIGMPTLTDFDGPPSMWPYAEYMMSALRKGNMV